MSATTATTGSWKFRNDDATYEQVHLLGTAVLVESRDCEGGWRDTRTDYEPADAEHPADGTLHRDPVRSRDEGFSCWIEYVEGDLFEYAHDRAAEQVGGLLLGGWELIESERNVVPRSELS